MKSLLIFILAIGSLISTAQTIDSVWAEINFLEIKHPEVVLRQSIWETQWYNCTKCCLRFNNLFGFRSKKNVTPDNPRGYFKYEDWCESVAAYKRWQDRKYNADPDYYRFLRYVGYAEDPMYEANLRSLDINLATNE